MKSKISLYKNTFKEHRSYSPEEVLTAGGTTAFALKMGKDRDSLIKALQNSPAIEPFTDEEWADLMEQVKNDK